MTEFLPYLAEHQPIPKDADVPDESLPNPSDEEKAACKLVDQLFTKSKKWREKYDARWIDYYKFFRGDQWKRKRASYLHAECINFVFQAIQSMVPILTEARPRPNFLPRDPSDFEFAQVLNELFDADWQHGNWLYRITEVIYDAHIYGIGYSKLHFDPELDFGLGRIVLRAADPLDQYPDPNCNDLNDDDDFYTEAVPTDIEKVKKKYAGHKYIKHIKSDLLNLDQRGKTGVDRVNLHKNFDKQVSQETSSSDFDIYSDKVLVTTCYLRPADVVEEEKETTDEAGQIKHEFITKRKYPKGRKIVKINDLIFEDGPLPNEDLKFPFQKFINYILPHEFFGISEVEQLESPQVIFNKLVSFALDVLTITGNPIWLVPTSSGIKLGSSTFNAPGQQIPYDGTQAPHLASGAQLQPYVLQLIDRMEQWFNGIAGNQEILSGVAPASITANAAIENLQTNAKTRIRQKSRNLDSYMIPLGEQYATLVLQNYTTPRVFRLTNKEGMEQWFKFHVEEAKDEMGQPVLDDKGDVVRKAFVTKFNKDEQSGQMIGDEQAKEYLIRGSFDVKINTGAGLPFAKAEREQRLEKWFQLGIIDQEEVLKQSEYPNYEVVIKRMTEKAAQLAQAEAMPNQGAM